MNSPCQQELSRVFAEFGNRYPDLRFGQMVSNVACWIDLDDWTQVGDEALVRAAKDHLLRRFELTEESLSQSRPATKLRLEILDYLADLRSRHAPLGFAGLVALVAGPGESIYDIEDWKFHSFAKQHWEQRDKDEVIVFSGGGGEEEHPAAAPQQ
jgi:hypothetical protein